MAQVEIFMPKLGESVMEATITKWMVKEGDLIDLEQSIVEIATDKVDSEVPSPEKGRLVKKLFAEGDVVKIGMAFALIETDATAASAAAVSATQAAVATPPAAITETPVPPAIPFITAAQNFVATSASDTRFYSPLVRNIAQKEQISPMELANIPGTGLEGRVTKQDILQYIAEGRKSASAVAKTAASPLAQLDPSPAAASKAPIVLSGEDTVVEMDRMRKMIAAHMVMSKHTSPHVTSYVEADVTQMVKWREKVKGDFEQKHGEKITFTPIILEAVARALREFPGVNASVDGDRVILRGRVNIGMAAALPSGNLIVPVIKDADQMNLLGLTRKVNDLANRARNNKLDPDDISGGTYTVTNVGTFGNVMGTPIINQPQVAILAVGAIRKKPAVLETAEGDVIAIRHMMFLSHSYDHRVVDGALGGRFVKRVAEFLESFDPNRSI